MYTLFHIQNSGWEMPKSQQKKWTPIEGKFKVLKQIENEQPKSIVAWLFGVPRNTISTWPLPANKEKLVAAFSPGINLKWKNFKTGKYRKLDKAVFKWFMSTRSSDITLSGLVVQENENDLAKKTRHC